MSEFKDFENTTGYAPSAGVLDSLKSQIQTELQPRVSNIMLKFSGIHILGAGTTLTVCPQFGLRILGEGHGLMGYFMNAGPNLCFVLCGAFFLSVSLLLARVLLNKYERAVVIQNRRLFAFMLLSFSLGALAMAGAEFTLIPVLLWAVGGSLLMETSRWTMAGARLGQV